MRSSYHPNALRGTNDMLMPFGPLKDPAIAAEKGTLVTILNFGTEADTDWWLCRLEHPDKTTDVGATTGYIPREHVEKAPLTEVNALFYLCQSVRPCKYWWFAFLHFVKLLISLIIIRGKADFEFEWKQWMIILLCAVVVFSHVQRPYMRQSDNRMEQLMLLGLVCIIGIVQTAQDFKQGDLQAYVSSNLADFLSMLLITLAMVYSVVWFMFHDAAKNVRTRESVLENLRERNERLRGLHLRQLFTKALPQVLLLEKEARRDVTRHFLREDFLAGSVIYSCGDAADLFYLVVEGKVTLRDESSGKELTVPNDDGLGYFGAGALLSKLDMQRTATAVAATRVTCLRIHRHDFRKTFATRAESAESVQSLFDAMDTNYSEMLERAELEEQLSCHAAEDAVDIRSAVDALMWILDDDDDGYVSAQEIQQNLRVTPPDDDDLISGVSWAVRARTTSEVAGGMRTDTLTHERRGGMNARAGSQGDQQQKDLLRERRAAARRRAGGIQTMASVDEGSRSDDSEDNEEPPPPTPAGFAGAAPSTSSAVWQLKEDERAPAPGPAPALDSDEAEAALEAELEKIRYGDRAVGSRPHENRDPTAAASSDEDDEEAGELSRFVSCQSDPQDPQAPSRV